MSHSDLFIYTKSILAQNFVVKFFVSVIAFVFGAIYEAHEVVIDLIFLLFSIDFVLGVSVAAKRKDIRSWKLFKGAGKLIYYGILLVVAFSIDNVLHTGSGFLSAMFVFIVFRDALSILENLELLGYKTPIGLRQFLGERKSGAFGDFIKGKGGSKK